MSQNLPEGTFSYKELSVYLGHNGEFELGSGFAITNDIVYDITWCKGIAIYQNDTIICKKENSNEIDVIFQILDIYRIKLLYTTNNLIDMNKINDWAFKDSIMPIETAKEINQCKNPIIFYRGFFYNKVGNIRYILRWKDGEICRIGDTNTLKLITDKDSINIILQKIKKEYQN